jgi:hypothetical protein
VKFRNHLLAGLVLPLLPAPLLACFCASVKSALPIPS